MDCPWPGEEKAFDRIMYVFGCNSRLCTEGHGEEAWRAFVVQRAAVKPAVSKPTVTTPAGSGGLWEKLMSEPVAQVAEGIKEMALDDDYEEENGIYETGYPVGFPATRLRIVEEMIQEKAKRSSEAAPEEIPAAFRVHDGESWEGEGYEKSPCPAGYDKAFERFQQRVASYPRQVVRFSPGSTPLFFYRDDAIGPHTVPRCAQCGRQREFELQLMPAILSLLPTCEEKYLRHIPEAKRHSHPLYGDGMEWATLLAYSCGVCTRKGGGVIDVAIQVQIEKE